MYKRYGEIIMTINELNEYILHYLEKDKTQTAIMLTGEWGSGKSYYINNELIEYLKKNKKDSVVVSMYGIESLAEIRKNIYLQFRLNKRLLNNNSELIATGKIAVEKISKNLLSGIGMDFSMTETDFKKLYESINLNDKLLIFEDLERSHIEVDIILGFINNLVEQDHAKVLIVANENEILKEANQYVQIKEKTISDTIQFSEPLNDAVKNIVKKFNNPILDKIMDNTEIGNVIIQVVEEKCKRNLRTFLFAVQKTVDILEKIPQPTDYCNDFYQCIFEGMIHFSSKLKTKEFPEWEGVGNLSVELGSNHMPLMKFSYNYVKCQTLNLEQIRRTYQEYKEFRLCEKNEGNDDPDIKILYNYLISTEKEVLQAMKNIEHKLEDPEVIPIYAYRKLAYYLIYVGDIIDFNSKKSCDLMINNVKKRGEEIRREIGRALEIPFTDTDYEVEPCIREKYKEFNLKLSAEMEDEKNKIVFYYNPNELGKLYDNILDDTYKYRDEKRFISKFEIEKLIQMLKKSTAAEIRCFRRILRTIYKEYLEFSETDIEALKEFRQLVRKAKEKSNQWDKIQEVQIKGLEEELDNYIKHLEN